MSGHTTTKGARGLTPGPWEWTYEDASMQTLHGPDWGYDHVLAVTPCKACQERGARCLGPREEDARLISAAPDLLEALEWVATASAREAEMWHRGVTGGERPEIPVNVAAYERGQATRAAIAKARGEDT